MIFSVLCFFNGSTQSNKKGIAPSVISANERESNTSKRQLHNVIFLERNNITVKMTK